MQLFVASEYRLRSNGRKIVKSINGSYTQGFSFGKYRVKQISAHICGCGRGFVEAFTFLANKKWLTVSLVSSTCLIIYHIFSEKKTCFEFSRTYWLKSRLLATLWLLGGLRRVRNSCSRFARQQLVIETKCTKYLSHVFSFSFSNKNSLNYTARELFYNGCNQYSRSLSLLLVL